jgi:hypothetical protein
MRAPPTPSSLTSTASRPSHWVSTTEAFIAGQPSVGRPADDLDGQRSPRSERLDCGAETAISQHGRMNPARQVAQFPERLIELLARVVQQAPGLVWLRLQLLARQPQRQHQRD